MKLMSLTTLNVGNMSCSKVRCVDFFKIFLIALILQCLHSAIIAAANFSFRNATLKPVTYSTKHSQLLHSLSCGVESQNTLKTTKNECRTVRLKETEEL